jgi:hypothetical protein
MPRCCGAASCSCVIQEGVHMQIVGVGSPADPFVVSADVDLEVADNSVFNLTLTGLGTAAVPWVLSTAFAATAKLNDLPDVTAPSPTNGQVLGWDSGTSQWTNRAPTTAASGSVTHDTSLAGDGSAGTPLQVAEDPAGFLVTRAPGLGLSDAGINQTVRKFADSTARSSATPAPTTNTLSVLGDRPGQIDYYDGTTWKSAGGSFLLANVAGQEMYQMSGPYTGGRLTVMVANVSALTDVNGIFDAIGSAALAGRAGIMSAFCQPTAPTGLAVVSSPFAVMLNGEAGALRGRAYTLVDGLPLALAQVTCTVTAYVY